MAWGQKLLRSNKQCQFEEYYCWGMLPLQIIIQPPQQMKGPFLLTTNLDLSCADRILEGIAFIKLGFKELCYPSPYTSPPRPVGSLIILYTHSCTLLQSLLLTPVAMPILIHSIIIIFHLWSSCRMPECCLRSVWWQDQRPTATSPPRMDGRSTTQQ